MCSKKGYPATQDYSGCIRRDHARFGNVNKALKILLDKVFLDIAARMTAVRIGFTQGQLLFLRTQTRVKKAPA